MFKLGFIVGVEVLVIVKLIEWEGIFFLIELMFWCNFKELYDFGFGKVKFFFFSI